MKLSNILFVLFVFCFAAGNVDAKSFGSSSSSSSFSSSRSSSSFSSRPSYNYSAPKTVLKSTPSYSSQQSPTVVNHYHNDSTGSSGSSGIGSALMGGAIGYAIGSSGNHDQQPTTIIQQVPAQQLQPQQMQAQQPQYVDVPQQQYPNQIQSSPVQPDKDSGFPWGWTFFVLIFAGGCYALWRYLDQEPPKHL